MKREKTSRKARRPVFLTCILVIIISLLAGCGGNDPVRSNIPIIAISPSSLSFTAPFGLPSSQDSVIVSNAGTDSLIFTAVSGASWIIIEGQSPNRIFVRTNSAGLPVGVTNGNITIRSNHASNSPLQIPVSLTVVNRLQLSDSIITFAGLTGPISPAPAVITLSAGGGSVENYTATWKNSWLSVSPSPGTTPQQITITPNVAGLPGGLLIDTVTFALSNNPESFRRVIVKLSLSSWTVASLPLAVDVQGLDFIDNTNGWAAGFLGGGSGTNGVVISSTDGGLNWTINNTFGGGGLGDISFTDSVNGVVVGDSARIFRTTDGGINWTLLPRQTLPVDSAVDFWRVSFVNSTTGFVIGTKGTVMRTLNGGASWTRQISNSPFSLGAMSFISASEGWIVGNAGTIVHTKDSGNSWLVQNAGTNTDLWGVAFVDALNGWVVGSIGTMLSTNDGGLTWTKEPSLTSVLLRNVSFVGSNQGWAVGQFGTVLHTSDGGDNWVAQATGTTSQLFGLFFFDQSIGVVTGTGGTILKTFNGGF